MITLITLIERAKKRLALLAKYKADKNKKWSVFQRSHDILDQTHERLGLLLNNFLKISIDNAGLDRSQHVSFKASSAAEYKSPSKRPRTPPWSAQASVDTKYSSGLASVNTSFLKAGSGPEYKQGLIQDQIGMLTYKQHPSNHTTHMSYPRITLMTPIGTGRGPGPREEKWLLNHSPQKPKSMKIGGKNQDQNQRQTLANTKTGGSGPGGAVANMKLKSTFRQHAVASAKPGGDDLSLVVCSPNRLQGLLGGLTQLSNLSQDELSGLSGISAHSTHSQSDHPDTLSQKTIQTQKVIADLPATRLFPMNMEAYDASERTLGLGSERVLDHSSASEFHTLSTLDESSTASTSNNHIGPVLEARELWSRGRYERYTQKLDEVSSKVPQIVNAAGKDRKIEEQKLTQISYAHRHMNFIPKATGVDLKRRHAMPVNDKVIKRVIRVISLSHFSSLINIIIIIINFSS